MTDSVLPRPEPGREVEWVGTHLRHLCADEPGRSGRFVGTQAAADAALASFDPTGYARRRNEVLPPHRRGASGLSPWIRHGLLTLRRVWDTVDGPAADVRKFRDELRWQEFARHRYARLGAALTSASGTSAAPHGEAAVEPWDRTMACVQVNLDELERDGWMVNQTRMWLASQWTVRHGADWRDGEQRFFTHLLDGSRAANRLGWAWTVGAGGSKPYGFSQWQVQRRAPGLCDTCIHRHACPIADWPDDPPRDPDGGDRGSGAGRDAGARLRHDPDVERTAGPERPDRRGRPELVWLTAESLGDDDPALAAHPDLPAVFVLDEPLLDRLRLSAKRLVFLVDRLAELADERPVEIHLGDPVRCLAGRPLATTFAPVPGWRRRARSLELAEVHPWPWLERPRSGPVTSFSAWTRQR